MPGNQVVGKDVVLIGQDFLAGHLGVTSQCVSNWYARELEGLPTPLWVHYKPGKNPTKIWTAAQLSTWERWHERHKAETGQRTAKTGQRTAGKSRKAALWHCARGLTTARHPGGAA